MTNARVSQTPLETLIVPSTQQARVSQAAPEVLIVPSTQQARISQVVIEVLIKATTATDAPAEVASGTGAAFGPSESVAASAGVASGTGSAFNPVGQPGIQASAEAASGSGSAGAPTPSVGASSGTASGTGSAIDATVSTESAVNAAAGLASGTGSAFGPTLAEASTAGVGTGTGAAGSASSSIGVHPPLIPGTGSAFDATTSAAGNTVANAGLASGTGTARTPSVSIKVSAGHASGTGAASDTGAVSTSRLVYAEVAQGLGAAYGAAPTYASAPPLDDSISPIRWEANHVEQAGLEWSMTTEEVLGSKGRATAYVQDRTLSWEPQAGWDIKATIRYGPLEGWVLFRGEISSTPLDLKLLHPWRTWQLECVDYNEELRWRLVGAFDGKTWIDDSGLGVFVNIDPNAQSLETDRLTIQNLFDVYIRVDGDQAIDTDTFVGEYLSGFFPINWSYSNLQTALEELAALISANLQFWIDPDLKFHWTTIPAWQDIDQTFVDSGVMPLAPVVVSDVRAEEGQIGISKLKFDPDGSEMVEQVYVRGGTGYVYNAPPLPPEQETKTVVKAPVSGVEATYELTFLSTSKIWHTDGTGFISIYYDWASPGGPYDVQWTRVPWNEERNKGGNFWKLLNGPYAGKLVDNDTNVLAGYGSIRVDQIVVTGGTPDDPNIGIGGSGWVGEATQDKSKRQAYLQAPVSTTQAIRNALGGQAEYRGATPTLRGSFECYGIDGWRVGQLVQIFDARLPDTYNGKWYVIQRVRAALLKGTPHRRYTIDFGDGPTSRYSAQRRGGDATWPPPAIQIDIKVFDLSPGPNSSQTIEGQLVNGSGQPWEISGKVMNWSFECYNAAGVLQTGQGSISPTVSVTDKHGIARTTLTTGPGTGLVYYVFADVIVT